MLATNKHVILFTSLLKILEGYILHQDFVKIAMILSLQKMKHCSLLQEAAVQSVGCNCSYQLVKFLIKLLSTDTLPAGFYKVQLWPPLCIFHSQLLVTVLDSRPHGPGWICWQQTWHGQCVSRVWCHGDADDVEIQFYPVVFLLLPQLDITRTPATMKMWIIMGWYLLVESPGRIIIFIKRNQSNNYVLEIYLWTIYYSGQIVNSSFKSFKTNKYNPPMVEKLRYLLNCSSYGVS